MNGSGSPSCAPAGVNLDLIWIAALGTCGRATDAGLRRTPFPLISSTMARPMPASRHLLLLISAPRIAAALSRACPLDRRSTRRFAGLAARSAKQSQVCPWDGFEQLLDEGDG